MSKVRPLWPLVFALVALTLVGLAGCDQPVQANGPASATNGGEAEAPKPAQGVKPIPGTTAGAGQTGTMTSGD